jgi:uncharacterized repeat protein (TIGR01451 family)
MIHKRLAIAAVLVALLGTASSRAQGSLPSIGGNLPGPLPLFPASNWWNLDISTAPVDPSSSTFVSFVGGVNRSLHADMGGSDAGDPIAIFGIPYVRVSSGQPKLAVQFDVPEESDGVDHTTETSVPFYPIPSEAITQPHWIEGGQPGNDPTAEGDRHMLIVDVDNKQLYELFSLRREGSQWAAFSGAFFDMNLNGRRPETFTSADAAGLAILPGLIRFEEVFGAEPIKHAFRVTVQATPNFFVFPASHKACGACPANAPPMGARFRLKASTDISAHPAHIQRLLQAMKTFGLIVADNGSNMFITGTFDTRWEAEIDQINTALGTVKASDFEVVTLGYRAWDLAAGVTDSPDPVVVGNNVTYTASATNLDIATAPGVVLTDTLPAGVTFVSAPGCTQSAGVVTCSIGDLAAGATVNRTITVTTTTAGPITNTVSVSHTHPTFGSQDSVPANDTATATTTVQGVAVSINDVSVTEGNSGTVAANFTVSLSVPSSATTTVDFATMDGTATVAGGDYLAASGTLTFAPGETSKPLTVTVNGDTAIEGNETFFVNLSNASPSATIADGQGQGTIVNDDSIRVFISVSGDDANNCINRASPCRTFATGVDKVVPGGEVIVLTTGSYGGFNVNKAVRINAPTGVVAFAATGIGINAGGSDVVVIRGLTLKSLTPGVGTALTFNSGATLFVENSLIDGWNRGVDMAGAGKLYVTDTVIRNSASAGLRAAPASGAVAASIERSRFERNGGCGVDVFDGARATVRKSLAAGNGAGFCVSVLAAGSAELTVAGSAASNNTGSGIRSTGGLARASGCIVTSNGIGLENAGGSFESLGNNQVAGNGVDTTGTITAVAPH